MEKKTKILFSLIIAAILIATPIGTFALIQYFTLPSRSCGTELGWVWISGNKTTYNYGIYGTKGVPNENNCPGSRSGAISWIDSQDNLWIFGGYGYSEENEGQLNDLWCYDGVNWTWVSGNKSVDALDNYGTMGNANSSNYPGARVNAISWTDSQDNLWLFGGLVHIWESSTAARLNYHNDLWMFNGVNWTWISGSSDSYSVLSYGIKGIPSPYNCPGGRENAVSWIDSNDNLWLFGGEGKDTDRYYGPLNDLWMFDTYSFMWTWVSGDDNVYAMGSYGMKGVPSINNCPNNRINAVSWIDDSDNLWLFGGMTTFQDSPNGYIGMSNNELWMYDATSGWWTWMSGSDEPHALGNYGTKGVPNPSNCPGARESAVSWIDSHDNLWLFGGEGKSADNEGDLNDLWVFNGECWTWVSGCKYANARGIYEKKTPQQIGFQIGSRRDAVSWIDSNDYLWLFGGGGYAESEHGNLNDLWKFDYLLSVTS